MSKSPTGAVRRVAAGLLAGSLTVLGIALAPHAGAVEDVEVTEASGNTRYGTAGALAITAYPDGASCVLVASGEVPFDSLAAASLAGSEGCPIVLVQENDITEETAAALGELDADTATIIGGTGRVSEDVEQSLNEEFGLTVDREAGNDRYETAGDIAARVGDSSTVIVASGDSAADALAAGPIAANLNAPIVLVGVDDIPAASEAVIADADEVIIVGGTGRISEDNQAAIEDASNDADGADRLAGNNRQETSVEIADYAVETLGWGPDTVILAAPNAPNDDFSPDALAAGPLGGLREAPILIVTDADTLGPVEDFIDAHSDTIAEIILAGGDAVLSNELATAAEEAGENTANDEDDVTENDTVTSRPELVSASIRTVTASQATPSDPVGTTVSYVFDEAITGAAPTGNAALFHIYNVDGTEPATASSVSVSSTDSKTALVRFNTLQTAASVANLSVATVDAGAVCDAGCNPLAFNATSTATNPEGDAPIGTGSGTATAGVTNAPDLVSVGNFRTGASAAPGGTVVDFTFDEAATVIGTAGYELIPTVSGAAPGTASVVQCEGPAAGTTNAGGGTVSGGNNTTVITVTCPNVVASTTLSAANYSRGVVRQGTVADSTGAANPLQAVDISAGGVTDGPDLVTAIFSADAVVGFDSVVYVFDEGVQIPTNGTLFNVYRASGAQVDGITDTPGVVSPARSPENNSAVAVRFPDGTLADAVGASVDQGAVLDLQGLNNTNDEEAVSPASASGTTAGRTSRPDLTAVRSEDASIPGFVSGRRLVYVFDEDLADAGSVAGNLIAYTADGIRMTCTAAANFSPADQTQRPEETDNEIACTGFTLASGGSATTAQIASAVLGTVNNGAVLEESGGLANVEGAEVISGSTGTPV